MYKGYRSYPANIVFAPNKESLNPYMPPHPPLIVTFTYGILLFTGLAELWIYRFRYGFESHSYDLPTDEGTAIKK